MPARETGFDRDRYGLLVFGTVHCKGDIQIQCNEEEDPRSAPGKDIVGGRCCRREGCLCPSSVGPLQCIGSSCQVHCRSTTLQLMIMPCFAVCNFLWFSCNIMCCTCDTYIVHGRDSFHEGKRVNLNLHAHGGCML